MQVIVVIGQEESEKMFMNSKRWENFHDGNQMITIGAWLLMKVLFCLYAFYKVFYLFVYFLSVSQNMA